ncbi:MAG: exopolysaccharide biosynthesis protein [Parvularculaceae bacterium]|nr:exopolysaccharide biosynthesis protein [Parvularculaceae bacterium]
MMSSPIYDSLRDAIRKGEGDRVSAGEILTALGSRAFGLSIIIIMAPVCLPMPPGVPTVVGVILSLFAVQMMLGYRAPWLPGWLRRKTIAREKLLKSIDDLERRLKFVERIARPRLQFLTEGFFARLYGVVFLILGIVLILPIPFLGNIPPALAAGILALALAQRDGLLAIIGLFASLAAVVFSWQMGLAALNFLRQR